ncbi:hypothetical protein S83_014418 [Arachis hypogaea]
MQAVEEILHPKCKEAKNKDGKKPHEIFTEQHKELAKEGEKWAKDTATALSVVGTLITTILFAAAFTLPGGNNQSNGEPMLLHDMALTVFIVADAISIVASSTSVLIFIGIHTSRYAETDFLKAWTYKLLVALVTLFLSVVCMMVTFCAALFAMFKGKAYQPLLIVAIVLASIPIIAFIPSQLRFFLQAVEEIVHPKCKEAKNQDGKKPREIFMEQHKELAKEGEKWAKETAGAFSIVGTLITTILFAAAFTLPGGNNQHNGEPMFLHDWAFNVFIVADAISLFASSTSVLIFIGILTSRYAEKDFLQVLPWKLLAALVALFLSVVCMMVAFCAALLAMLKGKAYHPLLIGAIVLASIPIIVFIPSQLRLFVGIFDSTIRTTAHRGCLQAQLIIPGGHIAGWGRGDLLALHPRTPIH